MAHNCNADCWPYLVRYGVDENSADCNPFKAEAAAEKARRAEEGR